MDPIELYEQARSRLDVAAGNYNHNVRLDLATGPVIVRIPIDGADIMDLRLWHEAEVLPAIAPYVDRAPRLLFRSETPAFQLHTFVQGGVLNDTAPRGTACPPHLTAEVAQLFRRLAEVPRDKLPTIPHGWPADGDSAGFGRRLTRLTQYVYDTFADRYGPLFARLGIPPQPLAGLTEVWPTLTTRPFGCVHGDVHRKNIIVDDCGSIFLDWELALWGDPVYDVAVHLSRMAYLPHEHDELLAHWLAVMSDRHTTGWKSDLDAYLGHEQIKSAIVDTVRYAQIFVAGGPYPYPEPVMIDSLAAKLNDARRRWRISASIEPEEVGSALNEWVDAARRSDGATY